MFLGQRLPSSSFTIRLYTLPKLLFEKLLNPFYFLIQGKQENVNVIKKGMIKASERLKYKYDYLEFGNKYSNIYYTVLPYTEASTNFIALPCEQFNNAYIN